MAGDRKECATYNAGPECVGNPKIRAKVEDLELAGARGGGRNSGPSAWNEMQDGHQADERSTDIDERLNYVGPDDGGESAFECIDQRQYGNDRDRSDFARPERDRHDNGDGINPNTLGRSTREKKKPGGERS